MKYCQGIEIKKDETTGGTIRSYYCVTKNQNCTGHNCLCIGCEFRDELKDWGKE